MNLTISRVLEQCDRMKPSKYDDEDKIAWLSALEGKIVEELLRKHEGFEDVAFSGYDESSGDAFLLIQGAYEDIYLKWLFCQIDFANAETTRYNNSMGMFNFAWVDLANWINRTHKPKQGESIAQLI